MGVGVGLQAIGVLAGFAAAQQQAKAYRMEAQAYKEQAEMAELQAGQQEEERNQRLRRQLAALGTSMSGQGVALNTSASTMALEDDEKRIASRDIKNIKLMGMSHRRKFELSAAGSEAAGRATQIASIGGFAKSAYSISNPNYTRT